MLLSHMSCQRRGFDHSAAITLFSASTFTPTTALFSASTLALNNALFCLDTLAIAFFCASTFSLGTCTLLLRLVNLSRNRVTLFSFITVRSGFSFTTSLSSRRRHFLLCSRAISNFSYHLSYRYGFALLHQDFLQDASVVSFKLHSRLVGLNLSQDIALLDFITLLLEPARNRPLLHGIAEPGHVYFAHGYLLRRGVSSSIASINCLAPVNAARSRDLE